MSSLPLALADKAVASPILETAGTVQIKASVPLSLYSNLPPTNMELPTLNRLLLNSLSKGTWAGRARVARALPALRLDPLATLDRFIGSRMATVLPSTVTKDIGHLKWLLPRSLPTSQAEPMVNLLADIQRGVRRADVGRPKLKALPMTKADLRRVIALQPLPLRAMALLAFRTASRVGDLMELRHNDLSMTPQGLLVQFTWTKTSKESAKRPDHRILVPTPPSDVIEWWQACKRRPFLWTPLHRSAMKRILKAAPPEPLEVVRWRRLDPQNKINDHFTLHSFKRGAAALAWEAAAEERISVPQLLLFLKHKDVTSALEYCPCPVLAARVVGSSASLVTQL